MLDTRDTDAIRAVIKCIFHGKRFYEQKPTGTIIDTCIFIALKDRLHSWLRKRASERVIDWPVERLLVCFSLLFFRIIPEESREMFSEGDPREVRVPGHRRIRLVDRKLCKVRTRAIKRKKNAGIIAGVALRFAISEGTWKRNGKGVTNGNHCAKC